MMLIAKWTIVCVAYHAPTRRETSTFVEHHTSHEFAKSNDM